MWLDSILVNGPLYCDTRHLHMYIKYIECICDSVRLNLSEISIILANQMCLPIFPLKYSAVDHFECMYLDVLFLHSCAHKLTVYFNIMLAPDRVHGVQMGLQVRLLISIRISWNFNDALSHIYTSPRAVLSHLDRINISPEFEMLRHTPFEDYCCRPETRL